MWRVISISVLLGITCGLQTGLEYRYRYTGRLASGITEMRNQIAAVGIQADLTIQVDSFQYYIMKFDNVEVGDFHDDHNCDLRQPISMSYQPLQEGRDMLQRPFRVSAQSEEESFLEVALDEPSWITNIRKSVVAVLPSLRLLTFSDVARQNFEMEEQILGGRCVNRYSLTRMAKEEAVRVSQELALNLEDETGLRGNSSSSGAITEREDLEETASLWIGTRSVDFDRCKNLVELKYNGNKQSDKVISRTSEARYVIRDSDQDLRVMVKAIVEGGISVFTSDNAHDHIDALTNQTLELRSVKPIISPMDIIYETRRVDSWLYQSDNGSTSDGSVDHHRDLKEVLTGIQTTSGDYEIIKRMIFYAIGDITEKVENLAVALKTVAEAVSYLPYEELKEMYDDLKQKHDDADYEPYEVRLATRQKLHNFKVAAVLAGTKASIGIAIHAIKDDQSYRQIDFETFFYRQILTSLKDPSVIPRLMELVWLQFGKYQRRFTFSTGLTTVSSLAGKYCIGAERMSAYRNSFTKEDFHCVPEDVTSTFIRQLRDVIQDVEYDNTDRAVFIQALVNLRTPLSIDILRPIIRGTIDGSSSMRITAMMALSAHLQPNSAQPWVFHMLTPIMENPNENPEIRNMAFLILSSWNPGPTWWKSRAISTWHEPSIQVANFISSTIRGIAGSHGEMAQMVSRVLYLVKPVKAISISYSSSVYLNSFLSSQYPSKDISIMWFASLEGLLPNHLFLSFQLQSLYGYSSPSKIVFHQDMMDFELIRLIRVLLEYTGRQRVNTDDFLSGYLKDLRDELKLRGIEWPLFPSWQFSYNDIVYLAVTHHSVEEHLRHFAHDLDGLVRISFDEIFHSKGIDTTIAYPTDIGIPFVVQYSSQSSLQITNNRRLHRPQDFRRERVHFNRQLNLQISQETSVNTRSLVPWTKSSIGSGIRSETNAHLPIAVHFGLLWHPFGLAIRFDAAEETQKPLLRATNHPYTVAYESIYPSHLQRDENKYKVIRRHMGPGPGVFYEKDRIAPWSGFWLESTWEGDIEQPSLGSLLSGKFSAMSPTHNTWDYSITYNSKLTETKNITFFLTYDLNFTLNSSPLYVVEEAPPSAEDIHNESNREDLGIKIQQTLQRINDIRNQVTAGDIVSVGGRMILHGSNERNQEIILTLIQDRFLKSANTTLKLRLFDDLPQGPLNETSMTCLDVGIIGPNFLPFVSAEEVLSTNFLTSVKIQLYSGTSSCTGTPHYEIQGNVRVSEKPIAIVRQKLDDKCDYTNEYPGKDIINSPLYDKAYFRIQWNEDLPVSWKNLANKCYTWMKGYLSSSEICNYDTSNLFNPPSSAIDIHVEKEFDSNEASVVLDYPDRTCVHQMTLPTLVKSLPTPSWNSISYHLLHGTNKAICSISNSKVDTFDEKTYPFTPNSCWKIATWEYKENSFIVKVRYTDDGVWEANVIETERGGKHHINNTLITTEYGPSSNTAPTAEKIFGNGNLLLLGNRMAVKVSADKVEIQVPFDYRAKLGGLCGEYNQDVNYDLRGPKGCLYSDPELYADSWEVSGDMCETESHLTRKEQVKQFQNNCSTDTFVPTSMADSRVYVSCITWEYQEKTTDEGNCTCKALVPVQSCDTLHGCTSNTTKEELIPFECHSSESSEETNCYHQSFLISYPDNCLPDDFTSLTV